MKKIILAAMLAVALMPSVANADQRVSGYTRSDGTYVQPYTRSSPNNTTLDNYSTRGNTNPYTGQAGTQSPDRNTNSYGNTYGQPLGTRSNNGGYYGSGR